MEEAPSIKLNNTNINTNSYNLNLNSNNGNNFNISISYNNYLLIFTANDSKKSQRYITNAFLL